MATQIGELKMHVKLKKLNKWQRAKAITLMVIFCPFFLVGMIVAMPVCIFWLGFVVVSQWASDKIMGTFKGVQNGKDSQDKTGSV
jgi:hypothetical protein